MPDTNTKSPKLYEVMLTDIKKAFGWLKTSATKFVGLTFATTRSAANRRQWAIILFAGYAWARAAANAHPIPLSGNLISDLIVYPFSALFAADIFRHVIVIVTIFWLSLRRAAGYLDDVFELNDITIAEKYILQAAFASQYDTINILDGEVAKKHRNSPIFRIGGPGLVKVHLENAALFEKANGTERVIGPTANAAILDRFERLRAIIDLRDQSMELNVSARTKDGITITSQGVKMMYSVRRGKKEPTLKQPHPFDEKAIKKIVYDKTTFKAFDGEGKNIGQTTKAGYKPGIHMLQMRSFIQSAFSKIIAEHDLNEILATIGEPEKEAVQLQEQTVRMEADNLASRSPNAPLAKTKPSEPEDFFSRDQITKKFYDEINDGALERGLQLQWIDIGTWVPSDETQKVRDQHLKAWELTIENQAKVDEKALTKIQKQFHARELTRLYKEVPLDTFLLYVDRVDSDEIIRELALVYREKLRKAWESYKNQNEDPPSELHQILLYLSYIL